MTIAQTHIAREAAVREDFLHACIQTIQSAVSGLREGFSVGLLEEEEIALFEYAADWATEMWSELAGMAEALAERN
jgi:hypothetical protein